MKTKKHPGRAAPVYSFDSVLETKVTFQINNKMKKNDLFIFCHHHIHNSQEVNN